MIIDLSDRRGNARAFSWSDNLLVYNLQLPYKYDGHHGRDGHHGLDGHHGRYGHHGCHGHHGDQSHCG